MISCKVIRDLIPLVRDGVATRESKELVEEHLRICKSCQDYYQKQEDQEDFDQARVVRKIRLESLSFLSLFIVLGILLGISLSSGNAIFYNLLIMPFLGGLAFYNFGKKSFRLLGLVFILAYLREILDSIASVGLEKLQIFQLWSLPMAYLIFVFLGIIIAALLKFALEEEEDE